jgi:hypothetical protein
MTNTIIVAYPKVSRLKMVNFIFFNPNSYAGLEIKLDVIRKIFKGTI